MSSSPDAVAAERPAISIGTRELIVLLALTQALQALAIDTMLPGLDAISRDLAVGDPNRRQLVIGLFMLGIGMGALIPGALADRYGRRRVLLGCIFSYAATALACALAADFTVLLAMRLLGGLLCAGLGVVPLAVIRDRFEGDRMASLQSVISMIFLVVPMLAPTIGQGILLVAGWRWIFGLIALFSCVMGVWTALRLPETLRPEFRQPIHPGTIARNMRTVLTTRASIGYVLAVAATTSAMWGYIQSSQQLVAEHFGAGKAFPLIFGGMAAFISMANFANSRIVERFGARRVGHTALMAYIAIALLQFWLAHYGNETLWQFVPVMTLTWICGGFMGANYISIALQPFARMAGSASSVQAFIRNTLGGIGGALVGQAYDGSARSISTAMVLAGIVVLGLLLWSEDGQLFRRLHPPGTPRPMG